MSFCRLMETSRCSGKAKFILIFIAVLILTGGILLFSPAISASGITSGSAAAGAAVPATAAVAQQAAAAQFGFLADQSVVYGIPIVTAVAIYAILIFARLSKKLAG